MYKTFAHTADTGLRVEAADLNTLFAAAAQALFSLIVWVCLPNHEQFDDLDSARLSVFKYIETLYNTERIQQTLRRQDARRVQSRLRPGRRTIWYVRKRPVGKPSGERGRKGGGRTGKRRYVKLVDTKHPGRCMYEDTNRAILDAAKDTGWGQRIGATLPCY